MTAVGGGATFGGDVERQATTNARVVSAVLDLLSSGGPDAVSVHSVAQRTGLGMDELLEKFGYPGELLYAAWVAELKEEFESVVKRAVKFSHGDFSALADSVDPTDECRSMTHLLVVSHRFDELREIIPFDVQRIVYEYDDDGASSADRSVVRALIGWQCGIALEPGRHRGDSLRILEQTKWYDGCWHDAPWHPDVETTPALTLDFADVEGFMQDVLRACTRIVAQGGVGRATLLRTARMAGHPPALMYETFGRQEFLIAEYVKHTFSLIFSYRRISDVLSNPSYAEMRLNVWLADALHTRRRALIEAVMASCFSPFLESAFLQTTGEGLADVRLANLDVPDADLTLVCRRYVASRHIVLGLAVLNEVELDSWNRDWGPFLRAFVFDRL